MHQARVELVEHREAEEDSREVEADHLQEADSAEAALEHQEAVVSVVVVVASALHEAEEAFLEAKA